MGVYDKIITRVDFSVLLLKRLVDALSPVQAILWRIHKVDVPKLGATVLHVSERGARKKTWAHAGVHVGFVHAWKHKDT